MKGFNFKNVLSWRQMRPHLCTIAVALSFGSVWRAPRDAFRNGGLTSILVTTVAAVLVALPAALLQLSTGQLSQQDAVGIWRAVPFFKGVGYIRLLISFIGAVYTVVYVSVSTSFIFYLLSNPIGSLECSELLETPGGDTEIVYNATTCLNETFLAPVNEQPEYYIALAFIVIVLWILFPFILYNPVKLMKRIFYAFGSLVLLLAIILLSVVGNKEDLALLVNNSDWANFIRPNIWHCGLVQVLLSNQIAGGYLISSGDSIYANTNVQWTAIIFVGANIVASWFGVLFWFAVLGGGVKETNNLALVVQIYMVTVRNDLNAAWPIVMFAMILFSGIITMLTFLYPLYDRFRRVGGHKWRYLSVGSSVVGACTALAVAIIGHPAMFLLEDVLVPCLVIFTTVLELSAFVFIYGWKVLVEDIEFLTGYKLPKCWVWGWCTAPGLIVPFAVWWIVACFMVQPLWKEPWVPAGLITGFSAALVLLLVAAAITVAKQVQYDLLAKLKSSFEPSRQWGPRDPVTHHYWLARREEGEQNVPRVRLRRRQLGQFSGFTGSISISHELKEKSLTRSMSRSNSDDLLVTCRRNFIAALTQTNLGRNKRSKSLDWDALPKTKLHGFVDSFTSVTSISLEQEKNNNKAVVKEWP